MQVAAVPARLPWEQKSALPAHSHLGELEKSCSITRPCCDASYLSKPWDWGPISEPLAGRQASRQAS